MRLVGTGYRLPLAGWIEFPSSGVQCVEITAEHFFDETPKSRERLKTLSEKFPVYLHGLGLSLGTPGPVEKTTWDKFTEISKQCNPKWVSEHISFTRTPEVDLGHLNPVRPTLATLGVFKEHVQELKVRCGKPVILENITSHLALGGEFCETEFINRLCQEAGCGLLLDATNLFINSRNHGFDPKAWVRELNPENIVQLHAVGYSLVDGVYQDHHAQPLQNELLDLISFICRYAPVQAVTLEWDADFPGEKVLDAEIHKLKTAASVAAGVPA